MNLMSIFTIALTIAKLFMIAFIHKQLATVQTNTEISTAPIGIVLSTVIPALAAWFPPPPLGIAISITKHLPVVMLIYKLLSTLFADLRLWHNLSTREQITVQATVLCQISGRARLLIISPSLFIHL